MTDPIDMAVKFVAGTDGMIEGLAIPFGGPLGGRDTDGETFDADTDLALEWFPNEGRPFLYHHGLDPDVKATLMGRQTEREPLEIGHWVKVQLDKRSKYMEALQELVQKKALSFSSGSLTHLARSGKDGRIKFWPWVELSGTPTPANVLADVYAVKAVDAITHLSAIKTEIPDSIRDLVDNSIKSDDGPETEPFAVHASRTSDLLDSLAGRAELRYEARAKAGRTLSAANRAEVGQVVDALDVALITLAERRTRLTELLERSDPGAADAAKAAETEYLRFLREQARQNGVPVGT